jgi:hypothetical protein
MIRSILSVIAGLVVLTIVSFAIEAAVDPLLMHLFPRALPNAAALAASVPARWFMIAYSMFSVAAGGYVTAWIARRAPIAHAATMGAIEVAFTLYVMIAAPFPEVRQAPLWGWIVTILVTIPAACLGGVVNARRRVPAGAAAPRAIP